MGSAATIAAGSLLAGLDVGRFAHAAGSDVVKIGFVGCGNRGTGACREALSTSGPVQLVAMGDLFADRLEQSLENLLKYDELRPRIDVPAERQFVGFDAYQKVIEAGVDLVLLSTPPAFPARCNTRPRSRRASTSSWRSPVASTPPAIACWWPPTRKPGGSGSPWWWGCSAATSETIWRGSRRFATAPWARSGTCGPTSTCPAAARARPSRHRWARWNTRFGHWNLFCWLCGDHLVEQACHEIDVANWVMDGHPLRAQGMGGRQVRTGAGSGDIFDHHAVEFEYRGGVRHFCQARQQAGTWSHVSDNVHGTKGTLTIGIGAWGMGRRPVPASFAPRAFRAATLPAGARRSVRQRARHGPAPLRRRLRRPPAA